MSLVTVTKLRSVQWDKSNNWEIIIPSLNFNGKNTFFPANDTELTFFGIENLEISGTGISIPKSRTIPNVTLSYIDDETLSITKQITAWQKSIVSSDGYSVLPMNVASHDIFIYKLNSMKKRIAFWKLKGFPTGNLQYHGDSDGSIPIYSVNFSVTHGGLAWN